MSECVFLFWNLKRKRVNKFEPACKNCILHGMNNGGCWKTNNPTSSCLVYRLLLIFFLLLFIYIHVWVCVSSQLLSLCFSCQIVLLFARISVYVFWPSLFHLSVYLWVWLRVNIKMSNFREKIPMIYLNGLSSSTNNNKKTKQVDARTKTDNTEFFFFLFKCVPQNSTFTHKLIEIKR